MDVVSRLWLPILVGWLALAVSETSGYEFTYQNPTWNQHVRDPYITRAEGRYYLTGTSWVEGEGVDRWPGVRLWSSDDLKNWTDEGFLIMNKDVPWFETNLWAPEICYHPFKKKYYLTWNGRSHEYERQCVGVAVADKITGPYTVLTPDRALTCMNDASLFIDEDGKEYLTQTTNLFSEVDLDNCRVLRGGQRVTLRGAEDSWEGKNEGPCIVKREGTYYLFYSGFTRGYEIGYASTKDVWDIPWKKHHKNPIFGAVTKRYAEEVGQDPECPFERVGHGTPFLGPDGKLWLSNHYVRHGVREANPGYDPLHFNRETGEFTADVSWDPETITIDPPSHSPIDLKATCQADGSVLVEWKDHSEGELDFVIERALGRRAWEPVAVLSQLSRLELKDWNYKDYQAPDSSKLSYRVCASNFGGKSGWSNVAMVE